MKSFSKNEKEQNLREFLYHHIRYVVFAASESLDPVKYHTLTIRLKRIYTAAINPLEMFFPKIPHLTRSHFNSEIDSNSSLDWFISLS